MRGFPLRPWGRATRWAGFAALLAWVLPAWSCGGPFFAPPSFDPIVGTPPAEVDAVVFLVGDAGEATVDSSPLVRRLREDVEEWSATLPASAAVSVLFLGDLVYPEGLHPRGHADFPRDSARLHAQIWTVQGPEATARGARGIFLAGNHDWGNARGPAGVARVEGLASHLDEVAERTSAPVRLLPAAGEPGPAVMDLGGTVRIIALDGDWWLQQPGEEERANVVEALEEALSAAGGRNVLVAAHHPFASGGPHGGGRENGLDPFWILRKAGAAVQDLNSSPYRAYLQDLREAFLGAGRPLLFAGGHDHSLQVHQGGEDPSAPRWSLVSGAGSKLSPVSEVPGILYGAVRPGYMKVVFRTDGGAELFVTEEGAGETFSVTYSARLR